MHITLPSCSSCHSSYFWSGNETFPALSILPKGWEIKPMSLKAQGVTPPGTSSFLRVNVGDSLANRCFSLDVFPEVLRELSCLLLL